MRYVQFTSPFLFPLFLTPVWIQFDMILGKLENDGSRKVSWQFMFVLHKRANLVCTTAPQPGAPLLFFIFTSQIIPVFV